MKRCPKCNQTFSEGWLSFCTQDGTTLIDDSMSPSEPPPTIMSSAPPPPVSIPNPQANWNTPSGGFGSGQFPQAQPIQAGWQPPPPPAYGPAQAMAITSMCFGIFTVTFGWCCYLGVLTGLVAIPLGAYALVQIKNNPEKFGGKPFAIVGIITAALYYVGLVFIVLLWGAASLLKGVN